MNYTCEKCGKTMNEGQFYTYRDGRKTEMCKKCLTMHVDPFKPDTFLWLLEKMDVPYIEPEWNVLRDAAFAKDPHKMGAVFGKYISKMKLNQYSSFRWKDTERLQLKREENQQKFKEEKQKHEQQIQQDFEDGKISEAEYKTLISTEKQKEEMLAKGPGDTVGANNYYNEKNFMKEEDLIDFSDDLTLEDKKKLAMKWGRLYTPNEWVALEKKYNEMMKSFDIQDSDTIGTLILVCKTYLKLNQAIDSGDVEGSTKLSRVYDSMRKSAKFTAAQNKEEKNSFIDSLGELVAYCEQYGGQIPRRDISVDYDIVDKVIRDLKDYTKSLIYEDTALARQIEDFIKKSENAEAMKKDREEAEKMGLDEVQIEDDDYRVHFENISNEKKKDLQTYYEGGEDE